MQVEDKVVEGVTYEAMQSPHGDCLNCAAWEGDSENHLCTALTESRCSFDYVWKIKDITVSSSQGVKTDSGKPRYTLIPPFALEQVAICLTEGLKTHPAKDNWKLVENGKERFLDSLYRHWNQYQMGEIFDRDNPNVRNLSAIIVNALFVLEFETNPELKGKQ